MVVRQRAAVHRARDARIWPLARPRRLHDAGLLAGEQRHGGELRENVQTRLRLFEPARRRGRRHAAAADLVRGLQRERATQRLENEVASRVQKSESNRLSVSDFKGATPATLFFEKLATLEQLLTCARHRSGEATTATRTHKTRTP